MIIGSNVNSVCVDDWTVESEIMGCNVNSVGVDDWTVDYFSSGPLFKTFCLCRVKNTGFKFPQKNSTASFGLKNSELHTCSRENLQKTILMENMS